MRTYFFEKLKTLRMMTGLLQYENIMKDSDDPEAEVSALLDSLMAVRNQFKILPDETVKGIIDKKLLNDSGIRGIYPAVINGWLMHYQTNLTSAEYYRLQDLMPQPGEVKKKPGKILTGKAADKYIKELKKNMEGVGLKVPELKARAIPKPERTAIKPKMVEVPCPKCQGKRGVIETCTHCNGFGRIKRLKK